MFGYIEMHDLPSAVINDEEDEQDVEADG